MNLAVSNIAWDSRDGPEIISGLQQHGVSGLLIAPTMVWPGAPDVTAEDARAYRSHIQDVGLAIVGLQSLVFGRHDVKLFGSEEERGRLAEHLKRQADLAGRLGVRSMIFGSPGLRADDSLPIGVRDEIAADLFRDVARVAADNGTILAIEPLSGYGNKYVTDTVQGVELVELVGVVGFGLHLDSAAIAGSGEDAERDYT